MITLVRFLALTSLTSLICPLSATAIADDETEQTASSVITVDFPGGTLGQYIATVREAGGKVNVVLTTTTASDVTIPPIHLDATHSSAAIRVLEDTYEIDPNNSVRIRVDEVDREKGETTPPIFRVLAERMTVGVWNTLELFCDEISPSDVLTAIENAVELHSEGTRDPQILFHESTGVLIARGTPRQVETISRVLDELRGHLARRGMLDDLGGADAARFGPNAGDELRKGFSGLEDRISRIEANCCSERQ